MWCAIPLVASHSFRPASFQLPALVLSVPVVLDPKFLFNPTSDRLPKYPCSDDRLTVLCRSSPARHLRQLHHLHRYVTDDCLRPLMGVARLLETRLLQLHPGCGDCPLQAAPAVGPHSGSSFDVLTWAVRPCYLGRSRDATQTTGTPDFELAVLAFRALPARHRPISGFARLGHRSVFHPLLDCIPSATEDTIFPDVGF
jgi:hypothetical protein